MYNLSSLQAFKIQKCPGSCNLIFFTLGPLTIRIKKSTFKEMATKMNEFLEQHSTDLHSSNEKKTLTMVK